MNSTLFDYFQHNPGRLIHKWHHYFEIYERHFAKFRHKPATIVEFGVFHGGSLQMWKHYFGTEATIIGVDINPACSGLEEGQITIEIGDQQDRVFLQALCDEYGPFDLVIDDGGHTMPQQINTFEVLYPAVREGGIYLVEDLLTSYRPNFNGGLHRPGTFIEYSKNLIDQLHAWHSHEPDKFRVDEVTRSTFGLHYYDSILVLEKRSIEPPRHSKTGKLSF